MEHDKIIIILLVIIIAILAAGMAVMFSGDLFKQECKINIKCNESMANGDEITIKLVDSNKTGISNANIDIMLIKGDNTLKYNATTDENGKATLKLSDLSDGKYTINCTFNGNSKYKHTSSKKTFNCTNAATTSSSSSANPIDANRPVNNPNYKGYNPLHESEITPDGWNPHEHEVSREKMPDGNIKIKYDDGYFRIVDKNGYVITYGFGG